MSALGDRESRLFFPGPRIETREAQIRAGGKCVNGRFPRRSALMADVAHVPDGPGAVVGDEERAIGSLRDSYGTSPHGAVGRDEAGEEVFVFAGCVAVMHGQS